MAGSHYLASAMVGESDEPSLNAPPVCRRFLTGGSETLVPRLGSLMVLFIVGVGLLGISWLVLNPRDAVANLSYFSNAVGALVCALGLAVLVSRWLGSRLGACSGYVWLGCVAMLAGQVDAWLASMCCLAVGLFTLTCVPGRLLTTRHRAIGWMYYGAVSLVLVLYGLGAAGVILAVCLLSLLVNQYVHSAKFFFNPVGFGMLAAAIVGRWLLVRFAQGGDGLISSDLGLVFSRSAFYVTAIASVWLVLAALAVVVGLRHGYHVMPFWRLVGCWLLIPLVFYALGMGSLAAIVAVALPAGCILAAAGLILVSGRIGLILGMPGIRD